MVLRYARPNRALKPVLSRGQAGRYKQPAEQLVQKYQVMLLSLEYGTEINILLDTFDQFLTKAIPIAFGWYIFKAILT